MSAEVGVKVRRALVWSAVLVVVAAAAFFGWRFKGGTAEARGLLQASGRIEGDLIAIAPKTAGRIAELLVREGDEVKAGQLLARLSDVGTDVRLAQARSSAVALDAQAVAQQSALELLRAETEVQLADARAALDAAQADLRRAQASLTQELRDVERVRGLASKGVVSPQDVERSELALQTAREQEAVARAAVARSQQALRAAGLRPQRIRARAAEADAARAQAQAAVERVQEAASQVSDLTVTAPVAGRISNRYVNVGEVVGAGTPLFGLTDISRVYLKGYLPEPMVGRVRVGQPAQIWTDAFPDAAFDASVGYIASRAEFTPKEVQTRDERTKLVYEVRLYPTADSGGKLLPGQPADAMIRYQDGVPWLRPQR